MRVLHGFFSAGDGLCVWGEDSELPVKSPSQALRSARAHPFALPAAELAELIAHAVADTDSAASDTVADPSAAAPHRPEGTPNGAQAARPGARTILLPSVRTAPLDSAELIRVRPRPLPHAGPTLLAWTVPVLDLKPAAALRLTAEKIADIRYGASLAYWRLVAELATDLVDRGRVLPALARSADGPRAVWRPVLHGHDAASVHALVTAMPPVARAELGHDDAHEQTLGALAAFVDATVRGRLEGPLLPPRAGRGPKHVPAAEAWFAALSTPDGLFAAEAADLDALAESLAPWDEVGRGGQGPAHATFRLRAVEPVRAEVGGDGDASADGIEYDGYDGYDDVPASAADTDTDTADASDDDAWRVDFLLQSTTDPSLLVGAEQAWSDDGALGRWLPDPAELLLAELGRASRVFPALGAGLRQARPVGLDLDANGAYDFLLTAAPALEEAGFGVLLPSWWDHRARLALKLSAATPTDGVVTKDKKFGKDALMEFRWDLAVGDMTLTPAEIRALSEAKAPLIRLRGQWVAVDPDQLQRGLAFIKGDRKKRRMSAGELLAIAARHPDDGDAPLPVTSVRADGWLGDLLDGTLAQSMPTVATPARLRATLRPYQVRGLSWLAFLSSLGLGACLADDMGLGKTIQLLALETAERSDDPSLGPTLLLCPMSLVGNWQREAAAFAPDLRVYAHHGPERAAGPALTERLTQTDLMVTTYATATRDIDELVDIPWRRVVLDEAQAIKNALSQSAKAAKRLRADHTVALTGTPMENRLAELWSIMDFLNPGMLGSSELFRTRYAIPVERHGQTEPAERLRTITRPYILRRLKTDPTIIDDLPEKIEVKQYCRLTTEQASLYQSVVDDMLERIENSEGIERRGHVLAAMAKLKQVCNHPALLLHDRSPIGNRSGKVARLQELLDEILAEGDKVLCFTQFTEFAEMLLPHLAARFDTDIAYLHGGTAKSQRDELVTRFQSAGGPPIFLLSLKAGGTGLNLTAANHVIHLDRWWNPAVENQATDRAFRIGQHRNVQVRKFICTGTLEERIDDMLEEKKALADLVIRDGEGWLTELSTTDLQQVFALSAGAVDE